MKAKHCHIGVLKHETNHSIGSNPNQNPNPEYHCSFISLPVLRHCGMNQPNSLPFLKKYSYYIQQSNYTSSVDQNAKIFFPFFWRQKFVYKTTSTFELFWFFRFPVEFISGIHSIGQIYRRFSFSTISHQFWDSIPLIVH